MLGLLNVVRDFTIKIDNSGLTPQSRQSNRESPTRPASILTRTCWTCVDTENSDPKKGNSKQADSDGLGFLVSESLSWRTSRVGAPSLIIEWYCHRSPPPRDDLADMSHVSVTKPENGAREMVSFSAAWSIATLAWLTLSLS
jgi:hypothetical protein